MAEIKQIDKSALQVMCVKAIKLAVNDALNKSPRPSKKERAEAINFLSNLENSVFYDVLNLSYKDIRKIKKEAGLV